MRKQIFAAISAFMLCLTPLTVSADGTISTGSEAAEEINLSDYTTDYDALHEADGVMFSGNQVLITFDLMVQVEGCCIDPDQMEWEISGTADATYTSDSFFESLSYEENYANTYCLITAESAGTVCVKGTEIDPYTQTEIGTFYWNLNVGEDGNFDGTVNHDEPTELPDWIPQSFAEAMEFHNTYGKNRVADDLICCVRLEQTGRDDYAIDAGTSTADYILLSQALYTFTMPEKPDETDTEAYEAYLQQLDELGISESDADYVDVSFQYEVFVYKPTSAGTLSLDWAAGFGLTNPYAVMHFDIAEDGTITQTDLFSWLPDSADEYHAFHAAYGGVTVQNGYIVYCDNVAIDGGYQLYTEQTGIGRAELILDYSISETTLVPIDGGGGNTIMVYKPVTPGTLKMTFTQEQYWLPDSAVSTIVKCFEIGNDGSIKEIDESEVIELNPGDCNLDGTVSVADMIMLQKYLLGKSALTCWQNADLCTDNRINAFDLCIMKQTLLEQSASQTIQLTADTESVSTAEAAPVVTFRLDANNYALPTPNDALPAAMLYDADTDELIAVMTEEGSNIYTCTLEIDNSNMGTLHFYATVNGKDGCQGDTVKSDIVSVEILHVYPVTQTES